MLAKIFSEPEAHQRYEKLKELIARPFHDRAAPDGHRRFAWPQALLFDADRRDRFIGYTMPHIPNSKSLDEFYDPTRSKFRERLFRVGLGIAVAELIAEVHRHHLMIVVGDINQRNFLADARGRVALIDLDSVQITTVRGDKYRCPVGSPFYTPAELLGPDIDFTREWRTQEHDRFGLAVLIFQLLFNGWHPFDAQGGTPRDNRIRAGDWPHAPGTSLRAPPSAPPFSTLPVEIQQLFTRAFLDGHSDPGARPTAEDWVDALTGNEKAFKAAPPTAVAPVPTQQPGGRRWIRVGVAACAAVVVVIAFGFFATGKMRVHARRNQSSGTSRPPSKPRRWIRVGVAACAAVVVVIAFGFFATGKMRMHSAPQSKQRNIETPVKAEVTVPTPEVKPLASSTPALPPNFSTHPSVYWERVRQQEATWEDEMNGLLKIVEEEQPTALRDPLAAVAACVDEERRGRTSSYFEYLVRHGDAIETGILKVQGTARGLGNLLDQVPAPRRSDGTLPLTERDTQWAVATIRQGEERAEAAAILRRVIRDEFALLADLLRELRDRNVCFCKHFNMPDFPDLDPTRDYPCNFSFSDTIQRAVEWQEVIRDRLGTLRAKLLDKSRVPEPGPEPRKIEATEDTPDLAAVRRPAESPAPEAVPLRPTTRQASSPPPPPPAPAPGLLPKPNPFVPTTR